MFFFKKIMDVDTKMKVGGFGLNFVFCICEFSMTY